MNSLEFAYSTFVGHIGPVIPGIGPVGASAFPPFVWSRCAMYPHWARLATCWRAMGEFPHRRSAEFLMRSTVVFSMNIKLPPTDRSRRFAFVESKHGPIHSESVRRFPLLNPIAVGPASLG